LLKLAYASATEHTVFQNGYQKAVRVSLAYKGVNSSLIGEGKAFNLYTFGQNTATAVVFYNVTAAVLESV